jgi:hypothetical protein
MRRKTPMKKTAGLMLVMMLLTACATTARWKTEDVSKIYKGQSADSVIKEFGQPHRKSVESSGSEVWEYRKPTASRSAYNKMIAVGTFGMAKDMRYFDVLKVRLKRNRVVDYSYHENVLGGFTGTAP